MTAPKPAYVYEHYPLWVTPPGRPPMLVVNEEDEAWAMAQPPPESTPPPPPAPPPPAPDDTATDIQADTRDALRVQAAALGIDVDRRWSVTRLHREIDARKTNLTHSTET